MADEEKNPAERTPVKKSDKIKILLTAIAVVVLFPYWFMTDNWHIFTQKRIRTVEQYFSIDFPEEADLKNFKRIYGMDGGSGILYLKGITDMAGFCRSCCDTPIIFMADRKNGAIEVIEYDAEVYAPDNLDTAASHLDDIQGFCGGKDRVPDFLCIYLPVSYERSVYVYGFENGEVYDVKIKY
ncbi:MAG: hypothetical protein HDT21_12030 [Ruminococcus sp.]|nr:hypothetical protein [Ruminococcus sp.]